MKNQKGFSLVAGLLIVVVIGILGFGGYYVWQKNNQSKDNGSSTNTSVQPSSSTGVVEIPQLGVVVSDPEQRGLQLEVVMVGNPDGDEFPMYVIKDNKTETFTGCTEGPAYVSKLSDENAADYASRGDASSYWPQRMVQLNGSWYVVGPGEYFQSNCATGTAAVNEAHEAYTNELQLYIKNNLSVQ